MNARFYKIRIFGHEIFFNRRTKLFVSKRTSLWSFLTGISLKQSRTFRVFFHWFKLKCSLIDSLFCSVSLYIFPRLFFTGFLNLTCGLLAALFLWPFNIKKQLLSVLSSKRLRKLLFLTLSWRRPLSYWNQSINLPCKSMDWFLYDNGFRHERVKILLSSILILFVMLLFAFLHVLVTVLFKSNSCSTLLNRYIFNVFSAYVVLSDSLTVSISLFNFIELVANLTESDNF